MTDSLPQATAGQARNRGLRADSLGWVFHDTDEVLALFRAFDALLDEPVTATNGRCVAVLGPPRSGKTSLVREYIRRCKHSDVEDRPDEGVVRQPLKVLEVSLIAGTRLNTIASRTLLKLNHPAPFHGTNDLRTARVVQEIQAGEYDLLVFDEIHHLVASDNRRVRENGSHWLTDVLNETQCPMILVGYSSFLDILRENSFLSGRLVSAPPLRPYSLQDRERFLVFRNVLKTFESGLGFKEKSNLHEVETAKRILILCNGLIGTVEVFLTHARSIARAKKHERLLPEVLREAAEGMSWGSSLNFNPFDHENLNLALRKYGNGSSGQAAG